MNLLLVIAVLGFGGAGFWLGHARAVAGVPRPKGRQLGSLGALPRHYGTYVALWCVLPALAMLALWTALEPRVTQALVVAGLPDDMRALPAWQLGLLVNDIRNLVQGEVSERGVDPVLVAAAERYAEIDRIAAFGRAALALALAGFGLIAAGRRVGPALAAREKVEKALELALVAASTVAVLVTIGIVLSLLAEALRFFRLVSPVDFLFGLEWSPQTALRADQVGSSGLFGAVPLFAGTLLISAIAMAVAAPIGLLAAIYTAEYARPRVRAAVKPLLEILAGIPTVVYGFFAALTVAPFLRRAGEAAGLAVSSESALAAGAVIGVMIIPFVSSLADDIISAVPGALREGSYGLGATQAETIRKVVLPAALPGIMGGLLLAASRAIGETMVVVMAAGLAANLSANPFAAVTTVTVQIVTLLVGDQEFDSAKTLAAFALGLVLFAVTLVLNVIALTVVRRYAERYD